MEASEFGEEPVAKGSLIYVPMTAEDYEEWKKQQQRKRGAIETISTPSKKPREMRDTGYEATPLRELKALDANLTNKVATVRSTLETYRNIPNPTVQIQNLIDTRVQELAENEPKLRLVQEELDKRRAAEIAAPKKRARRTSEQTITPKKHSEKVKLYAHTLRDRREQASDLNAEIRRLEQLGHDTTALRREHKEITNEIVQRQGGVQLAEPVIKVAQTVPSVTVPQFVPSKPPPTTAEIFGQQQFMASPALSTEEEMMQAAILESQEEAERQQMEEIMRISRETTSKEALESAEVLAAVRESELESLSEEAEQRALFTLFEEQKRREAAKALQPSAARLPAKRIGATQPLPTVSPRAPQTTTTVSLTGTTPTPTRTAGTLKRTGPAPTVATTTPPTRTSTTPSTSPVTTARTPPARTPPARTSTTPSTSPITTARTPPATTPPPVPRTVTSPLSLSGVSPARRGGLPPLSASQAALRPFSTRK